MSPDDLDDDWEALRGPRPPPEPLCPICKGTGLVDRPGGEYPCDCPKGDEAIFLVPWSDRAITGAEMRVAYRGTRSPEEFQALCRPCNLNKRVACGRCSLKDPARCRSCSWAYHENASHTAGEPGILVTLRLKAGTSKAAHALLIQHGLLEAPPEEA